MTKMMIFLFVFDVIAIGISFYVYLQALKNLKEEKRNIEIRLEPNSVIKEIKETEAGEEKKN